MGKNNQGGSNGGTIPPGAVVKHDQPTMQQDQPGIEPDRHRTCICCREIASDEDWVKYLNVCMYCAHNCDDALNCTKNKCRCPGGCCADHKDGEKCEDPKTFVLGFIGKALLEVCTACAVEIVKKAVGA